MTMSLLPAALRLSERPVPDGMTASLRVCQADFRSSRGYRWPFPGNTAEPGRADGDDREYTTGDPRLAANICSLDVEDALDLLEEMSDEQFRVTIRGKTADVNPVDYDGPEDPLWVTGDDRITKIIPVEDVEDTRRRWVRLARTIDRVSVEV